MGHRRCLVVTDPVLAARLLHGKDSAPKAAWAYDGAVEVGALARMPRSPARTHTRARTPPHAQLTGVHGNRNLFTSLEETPEWRNARKASLARPRAMRTRTRCSGACTTRPSLAPTHTHRAWHARFPCSK